MKDKKIIKILCYFVFDIVFVFCCCYVSRFMSKCGFLIYGFYYTYFILPFCISIACYWMYKSCIRLKILCQNSDNVIADKKDILELESKKTYRIRLAMNGLLIIELCSIVVLSIIAFYSNSSAYDVNNTITLMEQLTDEGNIGRQEQISSSKLQLFNSTVFSCTASYDGDATVILTEGAMRCPKVFVDRYYAYFRRYNVHANHKYIGGIQEFSTESGYGEYFIAENEKEICFVFRNENSFISARIQSDSVTVKYPNETQGIFSYLDDVITA